MAGVRHAGGETIFLYGREYTPQVFPIMNIHMYTWTTRYSNSHALVYCCVHEIERNKAKEMHTFKAEPSVPHVRIT